MLNMKKHTMKNQTTQPTVFLCTAWQRWGKGKSIVEARRNCRVRGGERHYITAMTHNDFEVDQISGGLINYGAAPLYVERWENGEFEIVG
jgi:hypothetical protein